MIKLQNVSKIYYKNDGTKFYALKNFTYDFNKNGMYCILGKSGSGKTTLGNLIGYLDFPDEGVITYKGSPFTKNKNHCFANVYRSSISTMIFQHYNLIKDYSVIENITLPRLAIQEDTKTAFKDAEILVENLMSLQSIKNKKTSTLSGGEMQRVAILRAIINNPKIIIADEPTGALDETNALAVMDLLKKLSKTKIVIVITHNTALALKYANEIIYLKDGQLEKVDKRGGFPSPGTIKNEEILPLNNDDKSNKKSKAEKRKRKKNNSWLYKIGAKRFSENKGKNILAIISTCIGLTSLFMIIGFSNGSKNVIDEKCFQRFDYGTAEISKTETIKLDDSILNLTKLTRMENNEILDMQVRYPFLNFDVNFDSLFSNNVLKINGKEVKGISLNFIYHFDDEYCDKSLLYKGSLPHENGVIINANAEKEITKQLGFPSLIGRDINISSIYDLNTTYEGKPCEDTFKFNRSFKISGFSKEFSFLGTPKIYISYKYIKDLLQTEVIKNLSNRSKQEITWYNYIKNADDMDDITSFSHKVFCPYGNLNKLEATIKQYEKIDNIDIDSDAYLLKNTFVSLMDSVEMGLKVFSILALIGTVLIIGINAFSSYAFERKKSAIMFAFGVRKSQVFTIFIVESLIATFLAYCLSVVGSFGIEKLANLIIGKYFGINNLISIPFMTFHNVPYLLLIAGLVFALTVCIIFTYLPLACSKKINLAKELKDE